MLTDRESVMSAALTLTEEDRLVIAIRLIDSVSSRDDFTGIEDAEFGDELLRRKAEMDDGTDPGISWEQLKNMD